MFLKDKFKRFFSKKRHIVAVIVIAILLVFTIKILGFLFGIGISIPPNSCDLKFGYELHGDVLYYSRDLCLLQKGKELGSVRICNEIKSYFEHTSCVTAVAVKKNNYQICDNVRENKDYGRPDLDKWECVKEVAVQTNNRDLCTQIEYDDVRGPCLVGIAEGEKEIRDYEKEALELVNSDLTVAIKKCQEFQEPWNQKKCYTKVSDAFSDITRENLFHDTPTQLINICLGTPNEYEWLACLYGNVFDSLTATDRFVPIFKEKVRSDTYKITTYCQLFVYEPGNPGKSPYYGEAGKLKDEICK